MHVWGLGLGLGRITHTLAAARVAYQPSLPSAVALTLLSILGAVSVVVGYFLLIGAAVGVTGYAIAKSAAVNRLEGGRARHGNYLREHYE
jgi:hypothetical protein